MKTDNTILFPSSKHYPNLEELQKDNALKEYYIQQLDLVKEGIEKGLVNYKQASMQLKVLKESYRMYCK